MKLSLSTSNTIAGDPHPRTFSYQLEKHTLGCIFSGYADGLLCELHLLPDLTHQERAIQQMQRRWQSITLQAGEHPSIGKHLDDALAGKPIELHGLLRGTPFQCAVWLELAKIPRGQACSYGHIAQQVQKPKATRAVGSAVGANPIAVLIPCHRVLPASGKLGNYAWGVDIKRALLEAEGVAL